MPWLRVFGLFFGQARRWASAGLWRLPAHDVIGGHLDLLTSPLGVPVPPIHVVPNLVGDAGAHASWRYVEFFTANVNNPHTAAPMPVLARGSSPGANIVA